MKRRSLLLSLAPWAAAPALAQSSRPAPPFQMVGSDGRSYDLAALKGKVVIIELLLTYCQACQSCARVMSGLQSEYGPKGLQILGVAVNDGAGLEISRFASVFATTFPVGIKNLAWAQSYLQFPAVKRMNMPRLVFIDRQGLIRYHYGADEPWFAQEEPNSRRIIEQLLAERAPVNRKSKAAPRKKS